ncbi:hypothetical protein [Alysiella crassa]|uniref:Phage terminase small subunit n=2 Tax=Alysiella crassa TaxID=153491 RepID=A0A376BVN8_9NEIS|nr:hypothetical protein [Alysiella crassa]SSY81057.1 Uncharacterised protein [Alysiella crassa]
MSETKRPVGRPSIYTDELAHEICERLANGESLIQICRDPAMPSRETIRRWCDESSQFCGMYARAREQQAHYFVDEMIEIADKVVEDSAAVQKARLQIDTRKWAAAKLNKAAYGDGAEKIININASSKQVADLTDDELAAELAKHGLKS